MSARLTDSVSRKKRSQIMSAVKSTGNRSTEAVLITILREHRINGWRRKVRLRGNPDFVFPKQRMAIFVDGCFWHGCARHCRMPMGNSTYWKPKIFGNKRRDRSVTRDLRRAGWMVLRIWEHELSPKHQKRLFRRIRQALRRRPVCSSRHAIAQGQ
jgi:DNA mismatch endonuclease (patch repair protein)